MPSFSMEELTQQIFGRASDARHNPKNAGRATGEAVGQVRRERRRTKDQSEKLIREFLLAQTEAVVLLDICDHLNRRPSPALRTILEEMQARGEVVIEQDFGAGPVIARNLYRAVR